MPSPSRNPVTLAIFMFAASVFLITVMHALVKITSVAHSPVEIMFYRGVFAMVMLLLWAAWRGKLRTIHKTARPWGHFGRGLVGNIGMLLVIWSFSLLPMADVTATLFAGTLMATAMSSLILKEKVGPWRWGAVVAGFIGVLMIVRPGGIALAGYAGLIPLAAALFNAIVQIYLRELGKTEDSLTTVFYFLLFGVIIGGLYMPFGGHWPAIESMVPLLGLAACGLASLILKSEAFSMAEASLLSPFSYTAIVWSTLLGWAIWGDIPTAAVVAGASIIIASNLLILYREHTLRKRKQIEQARAAAETDALL